MMFSRAKDLDEKISEFCALGDRHAEREDYDGALKHFQSALKLIPKPVASHKAALWVHVAIGDMYFQLGRYEEGRDTLREAIRLPGGLGNAFVHLRLGQCEFELGDMERAGDDLARAYMGDGETIFEGEDEKYLQLVKSILLPPQDA